MSTSGAVRGVPFEMSLTYEPYSNDPHYLAANREYLGELDLRGAQRVLDLACGTGTLTGILLELHPGLSVVGLDLSYEGLVIARANCVETGVFRRLESHGPAGVGHAQVTFLNGSADELPLADACVDAVIMGHSIHLLPDEDRLLAAIARVLRPGGVFSFATSFYAGTFVEGTEHVYHDWTARALAYIRAKDQELKRQGLPGVKRVRGSVPGAFSKPWPTPEEWEERLARHGFGGIKRNIRTTILTQRSFEAIGAYGGFAKVILSGYPVEIGCEALQACAGPTFEAEGIRELERYWLEIAAVREE
jgi:ubiquinone/menaquinone biosynthesis C-methylase UbiE